LCNCSGATRACEPHLPRFLDMAAFPAFPYTSHQVMATISGRTRHSSLLPLLLCFLALFTRFFCIHKSRFPGANFALRKKHAMSVMYFIILFFMQIIFSSSNISKKYGNISTTYSIYLSCPLY